MPPKPHRQLPPKSQAHPPQAPAPPVPPTTLGSVLQVGRIFKTQIDPLMRRRHRLFKHWAIVLVTDGQGIYHDALGHQTTIQPGHLILVFPDLAHRYGPMPGQHWRELYVVFDSPAMTAWQTCGLLQHHHPVLQLHPVSYWTKRLDHLISQWEPVGVDRTNLSLSAIEKTAEFCRLQEFLADALAADQQPHPPQLSTTRPQNPRDQDWASQVQPWMEPTSSELSDTAIASKLHMSVSAFRRRFYTVFGQPPGRYRRQKAIEHACELMHENQHNDKEIAHKLGFYDEFHFSHAFKKIMGICPRNYRRQLP